MPMFCIDDSQRTQLSASRSAATSNKTSNGSSIRRQWRAGSLQRARLSMRRRRALEEAAARRPLARLRSLLDQRRSRARKRFADRCHSIAVQLECQQHDWRLCRCTPHTEQGQDALVDVAHLHFRREGVPRLSVINSLRPLWPSRAPLAAATFADESSAEALRSSPARLLAASARISMLRLAGEPTASLYSALPPASCAALSRLKSAPLRCSFPLLSSFPRCSFPRMPRDKQI